MSHPDEGLIHAWLDGELDPDEAARVEALVESEADWAAAAAEARGLIAASARIVGTLDRVPANVIPAAPAAHRESRRWVWRAAAVLALMAGSAVVLKRESPVLPTPSTGVAALPAKPVLPAPARIDSPPSIVSAPDMKRQSAADSKVAVAKKSGERREALAAEKPAETARDKDAGTPPTELQGKAAGARVASAGANSAGTERRAMNDLRSATAQSAPAAAPSPQPLATEKFTRLQPQCFEQREPPDSVARIVRLTAPALEDSIRLETLVLRGDTLAAVNGRLRAIRVPCPAP